MTSTTEADATRDRERDRTRPVTGAGARRRGWTRARWLRLILMFALPLVIVLAGGWWYLTSGRYVSTDDAYVQADTVAVSADVGGRVVAVEVQDNQHVKRGQVLIRLDDRPYKATVEQAQAELNNARLQIDGMRATYRQRLADLAAAQDTLAYQQREFERQQNLFNSHVTSQSALDAARNRVTTAKQQVAALEQQKANVLASLNNNPDIPVDQHPLVQQAQARLDQAQLNLGYTVVYAPSDGIVTNVNKLPVGSYLAAATPAFSLVETDHPWIEANYKETELTHMKPGDPATITVDAYPDVTIKAHVGSLSPGTGQQFSVLPAQNASGNWVKVVQRLPVRLEVNNPDPNHPLRAGLSVTATVDTGYVSPLVHRIRSFFGADTPAVASQP